MSFLANRVERGVYRDSVALMRVARRLAELPGVESAALMIGTPSNRALLRGAGLLAEGERADATDVIIAVRAAEEAVARAALDSALEMLEEKSAAAPDLIPRSRSLAGALEVLPGANLALVSVPGEFAALQARSALEHGLHALVFSDNVPIEDELALKRLARDKGLLLMGPDCGTALIDGTPIAFANAVPRGDVGIVSASGTGLQEVSCLVARVGGGVSHGIGVGGRDLDARIGGLGTLAAIDALEADPQTAKVVLISKPPSPEAASLVLERVARSAKPFVVCFLGVRDMKLPPNARLARTLCDAAEMVLESTIEDSKHELPKSLQGRFIRGLYCGGTLCAEAEFIFRERGLPTGKGGHVFTDLGADEYTRGRPHPMIEPELRTPHLRAALADPQVAAVLVDLVLGFGSHADPADVLAKELRENAKPVIASVTGTERDPQGYSRQVALLREAGVLVAPSNAHASAYAAKVASQCSPA
jgi:FdrA protein